MKKGKVIISAGASLVILIIMIGWLPGTTGVREEGVDWIMILIFFGVMLFGILGREWYNKLVNQKPFNWTSMAIAFIVSPMIFGVVYGILGTPEIDVPSIILAFQNGFFWDTVFEGLKP